MIGGAVDNAASPHDSLAAKWAAFERGAMALGSTGTALLLELDGVLESDVDSANAFSRRMVETLLGHVRKLPDGSPQRQDLMRAISEHGVVSHFQRETAAPNL